jgi:hypothetical protein
LPAGRRLGSPGGHRSPAGLLSPASPRPRSAWGPDPPGPWCRTHCPRPRGCRTA